MIEAGQLVVCRRQRAIIKGIDFCAQAGEITVIIGPNGSGKSTLLATLAGELAYQGSIHINGCNMRKLKPSVLSTIRAMLPQSGILAFPFSVYEVVALGTLAHHMPSRTSVGRRVPEQALERVDLAGYGGRLYHELSGGEQARVQLARILTQIWQPVRDGKPCWLMLDEPVAALDIQHQLAVMDIARDFARQGGGVIVILHDLNLAACYGDRLLWFDAGQIAAQGVPAQVLTTQNLAAIHHCDLQVGKLPPAEMPFILPQAREMA